jgi:flagellum-specific ATP synthase
MLIPAPRLRGLTDSAAPLLRGAPTVTVFGQVRQAIGLAIEAAGPSASVGEVVRIRHQRAERAETLAEVVGFRDQRVLLMPLETTDGVRCGDHVYRAAEGLRIPVGAQLLGRVLDALGRPLDGQPPPVPEALWPMRHASPPAMDRPRIRQQFLTGIRALDAALPCGVGQRLGIFAGSGVGKSTFLGMVGRYSSADINVVALIGERGKEVRDFLEDALGAAGRRKSVVVVATSDSPALQRVRGAETAMAIAEYFRDRGQQVLFIMDSVTRYAMAQREIGLAAGEPPATKGYPPSVFGLLPRLLERAGTSPSGGITAFCTVLVEGDDLNEPIADAVRSIVDGHTVLARELAMRGHYPPVDVLASVSRVISRVTTVEHRQLAQQLRELLAVYRRAEDIISIGAYTAGSSAAIDRAIALKPAIDAFLRQAVDEVEPWPETWRKLEAMLGT